MIDNTKDAIAEFGVKVDYIEVLVETQKKATEKYFRGSPTLLVNGLDYENMEQPRTPSLACRFYKNGIPTKDLILKFIM